MGNTDSKLTHPDPEMHYFLLSFQPPDRIKLALANDDIVATVRRSCQDTWPDGFQSDSKSAHGSHKFKFVGSPFSNNPNQASNFKVKLLILNILSNLHESGWRLLVSSDLTKDLDTSTWFFQKNALAVSNVMGIQKNPFFCLSLCHVDKMQLIKGTNVIRDLLRDTVAAIYSPGVDTEIQREADIFELKLGGKPWYNDVNPVNSNPSLESRKLILALVKQFRVAGYKICGTANLGDSSRCMYFMKMDIDYIEDHDDQLCMISMYDEDGLLLIDADDSVIKATRLAIIDAWSGGANYERSVCKNGEYIHKFKIKDRPWKSTGPDVVASRRFVSNLFRLLLSHGWAVEQSIEISQYANHGKMPAFVLRSCTRRCLQHACINLCDLDKLRIIGDGAWTARQQSTNTSLTGGHRERCASVGSMLSSGESDQDNSLRRRHSSSSRRRLTKSNRREITANAISPPPTPRLLITPPSDENLSTTGLNPIPQAYLELIQSIRAAVEKSWPYGIDRERDYYGSREFRLHACPWSVGGHSGGGSHKALVARVMMSHILKAIIDSGWCVYASVDVASPKLQSAIKHGIDQKENTICDVHSWFLVYINTKQR